MTQTVSIAEDVARYLDDAIKDLRFAHERLDRRATVSKLREIEITLAALGLALDLEMEGEPAEAQRVLKLADWRFGQRHSDEHFEIECG
jgi:hypothetical protein